MKTAAVRYGLIFLLCSCLRSAGQLTGGAYLYTKPDPSAGGGIKGKIAGSPQPIESVFAVCADQPRFVYNGTIGGDGRNEFFFRGLPAAKYDLIVIFKDSYCEGLTLSRVESTLTKKDLDSIEAIISASEPFFQKKIIHRVSGTTGAEGKARAICAMMRLSGQNSGRYALKLAMLEDVGPGWQVERMREIGATFLDVSNFGLRHVHCEKLGGIRVTEDVKDAGTIILPMNTVKGK